MTDLKTSLLNFRINTKNFHSPLPKYSLVRFPLKFKSEVGFATFMYLLSAWVLDEVEVQMYSATWERPEILNEQVALSRWKAHEGSLLLWRCQASLSDSSSSSHPNPAWSHAIPLLPDAPQSRWDLMQRTWVSLVPFLFAQGCFKTEIFLQIRQILNSELDWVYLNNIYFVSKESMLGIRRTSENEARRPEHPEDTWLCGL